MRSILVISFVTIASLFHSCSKPGIELREGVLEIAINKCAGGEINNDKLKLCFQQVISDSRCPANAICIWQGTAVAKFSLTKNGKTHSFVLSTLNMPGTYNKDTSLFGYKFEFINLSPYPGTVPTPVPDDKIKAEVRITRL
jgi:hypothetical protein